MRVDCSLWSENTGPIEFFPWRIVFCTLWNTAVGIKNCKQLFSLRVAFTTQKKATHAAEMMSVKCVAIFWVVNASSGEKSCLLFSIPTGSGVSGEGGVLHSLKTSITNRKLFKLFHQSTQPLGNEKLEKFQVWFQASRPASLIFFFPRVHLFGSPWQGV